MNRLVPVFSRWPSRIGAALCAAGIVISALVSPAGARTPGVLDDRWIVVLDDPPTLEYDGAQLSARAAADGWRGKRLAPTAPAVTGGGRFDVQSIAVQQYSAYLDSQREAVLRSAASVLERDLAPRHVYRHLLNGFSVRMSAAEAKRLAALPGVKAVQPDYRQKLLTDAGPAWIGAPAVWSGSIGEPPNKGEGMVLGVVDTGINWDSMFFDAAASPEPPVSNPRPGFLGLCSNPQVKCSGKIIGVYDMTDEGTLGKDNDGHGSHVASTAAGYPLNLNLDFDGSGPAPSLAFSTSGVAPRASIISYKACTQATDDDDGGCAFSDTTAALEQALADQVDVINYSIGGPPFDPWTNLGGAVSTTAEMMLNLRDAGIFVSVAAGNDGPLAESVGQPANAPWVVAVANSTHDRALVNRLTQVSGGSFSLGTLTGQGISAGTGVLPIVHAADFGNALCGTGPAELGPSCNDNTGASNPFAPGTFNGQIVVCDRGTYGRVEKGFNVLQAGAGGMILANTDEQGESVNADQHCLPATHVGDSDGDRLRQWLASGTGHQGRLSGTERTTLPELGGIINSSSSRGPAFAAPNVMKPNITAPGTNILAAGKDGANSVLFLTGTSMAAPHVAGAALLLRKAHPGWSVSQLISALETTADATVNSLGPDQPAHTVDRGAGNVRIDRAVKAGLWLNVTRSQFVNANPSQGGDPGQLNLPGVVADRCETECTFTRTVRAMVAGTWTVSTEGDLDIEVSPASFQLSAGQTRSLTITLRAGQTPPGVWVSGSIVLTPSNTSVVEQRLPVSAFFVGGELPELVEFQSQGNRGQAVVEIPSLIATDLLVVRTSPLVRPNRFVANLPEDPTPFDPFDLGTGSRIQIVEVPENTLLLHAETFASSANDVDLYVGRDLNGDGLGSPDELVCQSITPTDLERCQITTPAAGDWWVIVQNWDSSGGVDLIRYEAAVLTQSDERSLVSFGPGAHPGGPLELPVYWDQPRLRQNERMLGAIGVATSPDFLANVGAVLVSVTREGPALVEETAIFPGREDFVMVPGGTRHDRLYLDVPESATSLTVDLFGLNFDANLAFLEFDQLIATVPATPPAPATFIAASEAIQGGRRVTLVAQPGQTLPAGRYYVVIDNQDANENLIFFTAALTETAPIGNLRGLWGPAHRVLKQGIDWQIGGGGNFSVWYTYDEAGLPSFYISDTVPPTADSSVFNATLFRPTSNDQRLVLTPVGEVQITQIAPGRLMYAWRLNGHHGAEMYDTNISSSCPLVNGAPQQKTGHWVSPDTKAGGVTLLATASAEAWIRYYYDDANEPRWVLADVELPPTLPGGSRMEVLDFRGFCIYCPSAPISSTVVGTLERVFIDANSTREVSDFVAGPPLNASVSNDRTVVRATFIPECSNQ